MRVAIFTGSATGLETHRRTAAAVARELAELGVGIVYGGGRVGLMGVVADAALAAGGDVIGVMPRRLVEGEIAHPNLTRLDVVETMHDRKARMAELADAFVAFPGGPGTLEELFEVWTWGQLGLHAKPTALFDPDEFFAPLITQLDDMTEAGYLAPAHRQSLAVVRDTAELLNWFATYRHPAPKWSTPAPELISVAWLCVHDGRVLGVRTRGRDRFYLPGGKPERGESNEDALAREVREELGLKLTELRPQFTITAPAHGQSVETLVTMHCYRGVAIGTPLPGAEIEELAWLHVSGDDRAAPAVRAVFDRLMSQPPDHV